MTIEDRLPSCANKYIFVDHIQIFNSLQSVRYLSIDYIMLHVISFLLQGTDARAINWADRISIPVNIAMSFGLMFTASQRRSICE